jgi:hypothetical protein
MNPEFEIEGNASSEDSKPNVYRDWELLRRIDRDLRELAARYGLPLDDVPHGLPKELQTPATQNRKTQVDAICQEQGRRERIAKQKQALFRLSDQQLSQLEASYRKPSCEESGDFPSFPWEPGWVTPDRDERLKAIQDERMARDSETDEERQKRWNGIETDLSKPDSWQQLDEHVFHARSSLEREVRGRVRDYGNSQGLRRVHRDDVVNEVMSDMYYCILRNAGAWYRRNLFRACAMQKSEEFE